MAACVSSVCSAMLPSRLLIKSNGNDAPRKSPTTPARSFSSRKTSKCRRIGPLWRRRSSFRNISTATCQRHDPYKGGSETSVRQLIHRVTRTIADWGIEDGYFADAESAEIFYDELTWLCCESIRRVQFAGLVQRRALSINTASAKARARATGFTIARPAKPNARATQYEYPQGSACFIQTVDDNMEDIMRLAYSEAMLFKYGSGTGTDLSPIRSTREKLSGGGRPSGPLSFLKVYDQVANVVKSGGKTRRAAKMNTLRDWHGTSKNSSTPSRRKRRRRGR